MKKTNKVLIALIIICLTSILLFTGCSNKNEWEQIPTSRSVRITYGTEQSVYTTNTRDFDILYCEDGNTLIIKQYKKGSKQKENLQIVARFDAPYILDFVI